MCQKLKYLGQTITCFGDLRKAIGDLHIVVNGDYSLAAFRDNNCLCALDFEGTAQALRCKVGPYDPFVTELLPIESELTPD